MRWKTALVAIALSAAASPVLCQIDRSADAQLARKYRDANVAMIKARDAFAKKDYARAKVEATAVLEKLPEFSEANFMLAKIAYLEKNYDAALDFIEQAKVGFAATWKLSNEMEQDRLAAMRRRRNDQDGAIADLRVELSRASQDQRQVIEMKIARAESIRAELDKVLNDSPLRAESGTPPAEYFFFHGNIYLRMRRAADAAQQYTEALRIDPAYADAANNLASLYLSARQYDKALAILQQAEAKGVAVNPALKQDVLKASGH